MCHFVSMSICAPGYFDAPKFNVNVTHFGVKSHCNIVSSANVFEHQYKLCTHFQFLMIEGEYTVFSCNTQHGYTCLYNYNESNVRNVISYLLRHNWPFSFYHVSPRNDVVSLATRLQYWSRICLHEAQKMPFKNLWLSCIGKKQKRNIKCVKKKCTKGKAKSLREWIITSKRDI